MPDRQVATRSFTARVHVVLRAWRLPLVLVGVLVLLQAAGLRGALEYRRAAVLDGQMWRLLTGSLVHLGWLHLGRDAAGLFLVWALFAGHLSESEWLWIVLCSAAAVGVGLLAFNPRILWYVGISGVLFGMFCAGALVEARTRPAFAGALLLGMVGLIAWTLYAGPLPGETVGLGGQVVPQSHLYGALAGATTVLLRGSFRARSMSTG